MFQQLASFSTVHISNLLSPTCTSRNYPLHLEQNCFSNFAASDPQWLSLSFIVYSLYCLNGLYSLFPSCDQGWGQSHCRLLGAARQQPDLYLDNNRAKHPVWNRFSTVLFVEVTIQKIRGYVALGYVGDLFVISSVFTVASLSCALWKICAFISVILAPWCKHCRNLIWN